MDSKKVCVLGLGHIGLPLVSILANAGYLVKAVDIDVGLVQNLKNGILKTSEPGLLELFNRVKANIEISSTVKYADIYVVAVPTLINSDNSPDISCVDNAIESIMPYLSSESLVIIESTCPIGTTNRIKERLGKHCPCLAYCPERVFPGKILHEMVYCDKVIGGIDEVSNEMARSFYQSFVLGEIFCTKASIAEAVKLAENTYRDINIAYANELSMMSDEIEIDVNEIIDLANRHPRVQILKPGPGVGGHCIAIDPWFLVDSSAAFTQLVLKAREINEQKLVWTMDKIRSIAKEDSIIACFGLTYKSEVSDTRESPAMKIVNELEKEFTVLPVDPYVDSAVGIEEASRRANVFVGLVAHKDFKNIPSKYFKDKIVLDFAKVFS